MLFHEKSLLVISDDADFLEVVKALPYEVRVMNNNAQLMNKSTAFLRVDAILFDVTSAKLASDAVFNDLPVEKPLVLVGRQADTELIARYLELREGTDVSYVLKPIIPMLLKNAIENIGYGQEMVSFMSLLSHESKPPTTSIIGYSDLLIHKVIDEEGSIEALKRIQTNARRLDRLIDGLAMTARHEKRRIRLYFEDYAPRQVIQSVVQQFEKHLPDKNHVVTINITEDCPNVRTDLMKLETILEILIENAYLYTHPEGQIIISAVPESDYVIFSVQDNGIGINEDEKQQVFSQFFRGDNELARRQYGNGMSLYNARLIINAHGGNIWFESEAGKGSTFYFTIPRADRQ